MAYNEIRTINNIQLEDIKAREEIEATKKTLPVFKPKKTLIIRLGIGAYLIQMKLLRRLLTKLKFLMFLILSLIQILIRNKKSKIK